MTTVTLVDFRGDVVAAVQLPIRLARQPVDVIVDLIEDGVDDCIGKVGRRARQDPRHRHRRAGDRRSALGPELCEFGVRRARDAHRRAAGGAHRPAGETRKARQPAGARRRAGSATPSATPALPWWCSTRRPASACGSRTTCIAAPARWARPSATSRSGSDGRPASAARPIASTPNWPGRHPPPDASDALGDAVASPAASGGPSWSCWQTSRQAGDAGLATLIASNRPAGWGSRCRTSST